VSTASPHTSIWTCAALVCLAGLAVLSCGSNPMPPETPYWMELPHSDHIPSYDERIRVEEPPELLYEQEPVYPQAAIDAGQEGKVGIQALVDWNGAVREVRVAVSCGYPALDESAAAAAHLSRWKPAIVDGYRVSVWVRYSVVFELPE